VSPRGATLASPRAYCRECTPAPRLAPPAAPERVLAALSALGGSGTVEQIRQQTGTAGVPLSAGCVSATLNALARLDPPAVSATGSPRGGAGKARVWYLPGCAPAPPPPILRAAAARPRRTRRTAPGTVPFPQAGNAARNVRALRLRAGLSGAETARRAGLSQASLSLFESGRRRLSAGRLEDLARVLGSTLGELTGDRCAACLYLPEARGHRVECLGLAA
jgi:hypothetical protein